MAKYLKPRRGKYTDANSQNINLKRGEMFLCLSNNDNIGQGPGALYIGDGASSFSEFSHDGSTVSNTAQPILVHPMIYKPIFENSNPSTSSWTVDAGTSEIDSMGDGSASVTLPTIIGNVKGALSKHADSIKALDEDKASKSYVDTAIDNLPEPMVYKGTLGVNGTTSALPNASTANEGFTYKVITAGTYDGQEANVGDMFTSNATSWVLFPAGDPDTDTWRNIKVNGTEELGTGISSGAVDFVNGNNTTVTFDSTGNKISIDAAFDSELDTMTLSEYNALSTAQKNDGTARFIPKNSIGSTTDIDMTNITGYYENAQSMNVTAVSSSEIDITWNGSVYLGCSFKFNEPIDVTSWDKIIFDLSTGSCYGGGATAQRPDWYIQVGLLNYSINSAININPSSSDWKAVTDFSMSNHDYGRVEVDVSNLTGSYYLTCVCHGWNATIENVKLAMLGGYSSQIKYMSETYGEQVVFGGATTASNGTSGSVPAPTSSDVNKFLKADGTWAEASYDDFDGATTATAGTHGLVPAPTTADVDKFLKGDGTWDTVATSDDKVAQTESSANANYEVLLSNNASTAAETDGVKKSSGMTFNPNTGNVTITGALSDKNGLQTIRRITEAEYELLSSAEKNDGTIYHITDRDSSGGSGGANDKVAQTESTANADYEVILSNNASTASETDGVKKSSGFKYNPSTGNVTISGTLTDKNGLQTIRRISEADYQALSTAEKNNGTIYHRYDATDAESLDTNVMQTESTANAEYEVLLSNNASTATETSGIKKSSGLKFNPSTGKVSTTMISVSGTPTANTDVVTKQYVDNLIDTAITQVLEDLY